LGYIAPRFGNCFDLQNLNDEAHRSYPDIMLVANQINIGGPMYKMKTVESEPSIDFFSNSNFGQITCG
jgi:hypothetical protein